jgi:hypothetical protein
MTNTEAQAIAAAYLRVLAAREALADAETRSTGLVALRQRRRELTDAGVALDAAVAEVSHG